jgi:hypothetical protein
MKDQKINWLAVLVAVVLQFALGFLWYGPLFGDPWMEMVGLDPATVEANPPGAGVWISNIIAAALSMLVLAWLFVKLNVKTLVRGIWIGFVIGFVFVLMSIMVSGFYADSPYWLAWITGGNTTVGLMLGGAVLGVWPSYRS